MIFILTLLYLFSYSELPLAVFFLILMIFHYKYHFQLIVALIVVLLDCLLKYIFVMDYGYRFFHNLFLVTVLVMVLSGKQIRIGHNEYRFVFYFLVGIAIYRYWDMSSNSVLYFEYLNENLIGLSIFSLAIVRGPSLISYIVFSLLSIKGLLLLSIFAFRQRLIVFVSIVSFIFIFFYFNSGVGAEIYQDLQASNVTSGRSVVWNYVFNNYVYGSDYKKLLYDGYSNTESFFLNQIYSISFMWPLTVAMSLICSYKISKSNFTRAAIVIVLIFYPFPIIIFINKIFEPLKFSGNKFDNSN